MCKIPTELLEKLDEHKVVPFIGAGFSRNFNYPSWNELLSKITSVFASYGIIDIDNIPVNEVNLNPLIYAEALYSFFEKWARLPSNRNKVFELAKKVDNNSLNIIDICNTAFNNIVIECATVDEKILKCEYDFSDLKEFNFKTVITTNYDNILEDKIFTNLKDKIYYPSKDLEINIKPTYEGIFKIHGDRMYPDSIVLTNRQYYKFMRENTYIKNTMYNLFVTNSFLFIGYGFSDINILDIYFNFINDYSEKSKNRSFMLIIKQYSNMTDSEYILYKEYLEYNNIMVIDSFDTIEDFTKCLYKSFKNYKENKPFNEYNNFNYIKDTIYNALNNKEVIINNSFNQDVIKFLNDSFKYKSMLQKSPFNLELEYDDFSYNDKINLFDLYIKIYNEDINLLQTDYYYESICIIADSITTLDFYNSPVYLRKFIELVSLWHDGIFDCDSNIKNLICVNFLKILSSSGRSYGDCWGFVNVLNSEMINITTEFLEMFIDYILNLFEDDDNDYNISLVKNPNTINWLNKIKSRSKKIQVSISIVNEILELY